jgi:predicted ATPase/class 3 adenylate cyclase
MDDRKQRIESAITALEAQRAALGDGVVDAAIATLRAKLALPQPEPPTSRLAHVSVLFLDVVGSTALARQLDAEDLQAVIDGLLVRCTALVETHGGKVLQYAGDSLLAVFGAERTEEDDAERAVRTGLALLEEGRREGAHVLRRHDHAGFDVRVGIHSGGVLLGGGVDAEGSIRGITVHIAARMEQTAPAGALRISRETYRQVRGLFEVRPEAPIPIKGVDELVTTYLVLGSRARAFDNNARGIEGLGTRLVGRDAELAALRDAFALALAERRLVVVTVIGDGGIGKSRLRREFEATLEAGLQPFDLLRGRADPQARSRPYGLLRDVVARRLQISDDDTIEAAKTKLERGLGTLFEAGEDAPLAAAHAHLLGHLIGLDYRASPHVSGIRDDARQIRQRAFHAAARWLRRMGELSGAPSVLLLEDLHWADDGSLDFLQHLVQHSADLPMLMLGLARPELLERRADWPGPTDAHRIELAPLERGASRLLATELLRRLPAPPEALLNLVMAGAEGNPFYMEELVRMLVDEGALEAGAEGWVLHADRLAALHVPATLTGVLQARLDALAPDEKRALQQASVIGVVFWDQALAAIDAAAPSALPRTVQRGLVEPHKDTLLEGSNEFAFKHQLLHGVAYETVLKRLRQAYHARVAHWLARLGGARAGEMLGVVAEHHAKAGDDSQAAEYYARAASYAAERHANEAVLAHVASGLALPGSADDAALCWRLVELRERALDLAGRRVEQLADIERLEHMAEAIGDDARRAEAAWRRSDFAIRTGDFRAGEAAARCAMAHAERADATALRLRAQHRLVNALTHQGDLNQAHTLARAGLAEVRALGLRTLESLFLNGMIVVAAAHNDHLRCLALAREQLPINRELGNRRAEATTLGNLGSLLAAFGAWDEARECYDASLLLARGTGDRVQQMNTLSQRAHMQRVRGDEGLGIAPAKESLAIARSIRNPHGEGVAWCCLGGVELARGDLEAAEAAFKTAHAMAVQLGMPFAHDATAGLVEVALARGVVAAALAKAEGLIVLTEAGCDSLGGTDELSIRWVCHRTLAAADDARADAALAATHAELLRHAAAIEDPKLRESYLEAVPEHSAIRAAWAVRPRR